MFTTQFVVVVILIENHFKTKLIDLIQKITLNFNIVYKLFVVPVFILSIWLKPISFKIYRKKTKLEYLKLRFCCCCFFKEKMQITTINYNRASYSIGYISKEKLKKMNIQWLNLFRRNFPPDNLFKQEHNSFQICVFFLFDVT